MRTRICAILALALLVFLPLSPIESQGRGKPPEDGAVQAPPAGSGTPGAGGAITQAAAPAAASSVSPVFPFPGRLVIAHRGASGYLPEHSLEAKALAWGMGADYVEHDVVLTKDNVPVIFHDLFLDAVTDVRAMFPGRARADGLSYTIDFTLAELRTLSLGERVDPETGKPVYPGRFPPGTASFSIHTLAEELELIRGLNRSARLSPSRSGGSGDRRVGVFTEIKEPEFFRLEGRDIARIVLDTLARCGFGPGGEKVFVMSFDAACLKRIRFELRSPLPLIQLISINPLQAGMLTDTGLDAIAAYAQAIGPSTGLLVDRRGRQVRDGEVVKSAHARGLAVYPYTFRADALPPYAKSSAQDMEFFLFTVGVDGVITDFPDIGVGVLREHGLR